MSKKQPLSYQEFKRAAFEQIPKTKTYGRRQLRAMYRDYLKNLKRGKA